MKREGKGREEKGSRREGANLKAERRGRGRETEGRRDEGRGCLCLVIANVT